MEHGIQFEKNGGAAVRWRLKDGSIGVVPLQDDSDEVRLFAHPLSLSLSLLLGSVLQGIPWLVSLLGDPVSLA